RRELGDEAAEGPPAVLRIMLVFSMVSVFWALFDQHASTWVQQAIQLERTLVVPTTLGYTAVGATIALALYGGTWLMLWVSNVRVPKIAHVIAIGLAAVALIGAGVVDLVTGRTMTIELAAAQ